MNEECQPNDQGHVERGAASPEVGRRAVDMLHRAFNIVVDFYQISRGETVVYVPQDLLSKETFDI